MKKKHKINPETQYWANREITDPFELTECFFVHYKLDCAKSMLAEIMLHLHKREICRKEFPAQLFDFYKALRSFIRAAYLLKFKAKKWTVKEVPEQWPVISQASLNQEEYENPFLVFEKAFEVQAPGDYDFFLNEIVDIALSPCREETVQDLITPYIYLVKMLDAAQTVSDRGVVKC